MRYLKPFWSFLFSHGLIFLSTGLIFLFRLGTDMSNRLFIPALLFFAVSIIQSLILWKQEKKELNWFPPLFLISSDLILGILILYAPEVSMRIYVLILSGWSALMALLLLAPVGVKSRFRAGMAAAGLSFLAIAIYMVLQLNDLESMDVRLLGILSLVFSVFLIFISLQLRFQKKQLPMEDQSDKKKHEE